MDCIEMDRILIGTNDVEHMPVRAQDHLAGCKRCREFVTMLREAQRSEATPTQVVQSITERMLDGLRPVQPLRDRYLFLGFAAVVVSVVGIAVLRLGAFALVAMSPFQAAAVLCALVAAAALLADSVVRQMVPGSKHRVDPKILPFLVLASLVILVLLLFPFHQERHFWTDAWRCIRPGTSIGLVAAIPFWYLLRQGAVLSPRVTGVSSGVLAGLTGASVLEIHCANLSAAHIVVSHLGLPLLGSVVGYAIGLAVQLMERRTFGPERD